MKSLEGPKIITIIASLQRIDIENSREKRLAQGQDYVPKSITNPRCFKKNTIFLSKIKEQRLHDHKIIKSHIFTGRNSKPNWNFIQIRNT